MKELDTDKIYDNARAQGMTPDEAFHKTHQIILGAVYSKKKELL